MRDARGSLNQYALEKTGSAEVIRDHGVSAYYRWMKRSDRMKGKHPELQTTHVRCNACGNEFTTRSMRAALVLDVCANCHPAYTGLERPTVQGSRIERFERRRLRAATS
jgi:large subunit ribosomal protein L31